MQQQHKTSSPDRCSRCLTPQVTVRAARRRVAADDHVGGRADAGLDARDEWLWQAASNISPTEVNESSTEQAKLFYYYREAQKETYRVEWARTRNECLCGSSPNCYPRSADSLQCGECFSCASIELAYRERNAEMVFAMSSNHIAMSKVLVLIASIHKIYPSTKILLYDNLDEKDSLLHKQLVSVRNLQVLPAKIADKYLGPDSHTSQKNVFFMLDALSRYESVLWFNDDLEILSKNLDEVLNKSTSTITTIGREYAAWEKKNAFVSYFPGISASTKNYTLLFLRDGAQSTLQWIAKCAAEPQQRCWDCRDHVGDIIDCMPGLLSRLALDTRIEHKAMPVESVQHQRWEPPGCDTRCIVYTLISIIFFIFIAVAVALLLFSRATNKSK
ncbi:hypothetical protein RB195_025950 [Necator americanus]|uniref:Uncharacterized protein n=1 Tax=Necator americanus TaxID=51031 RepID=A0ABR1EWY1_NECAM